MNDEQVRDGVAKLLGMFPNLDRFNASQKLGMLLTQFVFPHALELAVDYFLEHPIEHLDLPPRKPEAYHVVEHPIEILEVPSQTAEACSAKRRENAGFSRSTTTDGSNAGFVVGSVGPQPMRGDYYDWCVHRFGIHFPRIALPVLKSVINYYGQLTTAYKAVAPVYQCLLAGTMPSVGSQDELAWWPRKKLKLLKYDRPPREPPRYPCRQFEEDWTALVNSGEILPYCENNELPAVCEIPVECGCCCCDVPFEKMVQCADGHLFCSDCLRRHVEEFTFGGGQASTTIQCMNHADNCAESFPCSEVQRALPPNVLLKYEQRQAEDAVARAKLHGLVYCPFCNHPWEVDPSVVVLECDCGKHSCVLCKEPSHVPLRCEEVEKKSETLLRRQIEESMSKALIRECPACKSELVKNGGCNKVQCRCGAIMCYMCRNLISNYSHFCQHVREPGQASCKICSGCSLWEKEDEDKIVQAAKLKAMEEKNVLKRDLDIGPALENLRKKRPCQ